MDGFCAAENARMRGEIVERSLDSFSRGKGRNVCGKERAFDERGIVEVLMGALCRRHVREIEVVIVEREMDAVEGTGKLTGEGGFAGAGEAGDAEDDGLERG